MKFSGSIISALLLVVPSLVTAAPANEPGLTKREPHGMLVARAEKCNAKVPTDKAQKEKYDNKIKSMNKATSEAHQSQDACPESKKADFTNEKNKQKIVSPIGKGTYL